MGISRITGYIIANNAAQIECAAGGEGPYSGFVFLRREERAPRLLLSTGPDYETREAAVAAMQEAVRVIIDSVQAEIGDQDPLMAFMEGVAREAAEKGEVDGPVHTQ